MAGEIFRLGGTSYDFVSDILFVTVALNGRTRLHCSTTYALYKLIMCLAEQVFSTRQITLPRALSKHSAALLE
jgi:hypothetical protein